MLFKKYNKLLFFLKKYFLSQTNKNPRAEEEKIIKDIRNVFRKKKKLKQLNIEYLEILRIFFSMKNKKKIIMNH